MPRGYDRPDANTSFDISIDPRPMYHLAAAMREAKNGKVLRAELSKNLRVVSRPAIVEARAAIRSAPGGPVFIGESLRTAIATSIRPTIKYGKNSTGLAIRQGTTIRVRGFRYAGRAFNRPSFRHPVYGNRERWVAQVGKPGWFDLTMQKQGYRMRGAVTKAIADMAAKVAAQSTNRG